MTRRPMLSIPAHRRLARLRAIADKHSTTWREIRNTYRDTTAICPSTSGRGGAEFQEAGTLLAWIENPDSVGLRFVGYADELSQSIRHTGWYSDDDGVQETVRGVVYQLPARNGVPRYIHGYADPYNDGPAALALRRNEWADNERDAAVWADQVAEHVAEDMRDYNRAWQAGAEWADLAEEIAATRRETLALLAESRPLRRVMSAETPTLCATLRKTVRRALADIEAARKERARLFDDYGREEGFREHLPA